MIERLKELFEGTWEKMEEYEYDYTQFENRMHVGKKGRLIVERNSKTFEYRAYTIDADGHRAERNWEGVKEALEHHRNKKEEEVV